MILFPILAMYDDDDYYRPSGVSSSPRLSWEDERVGKPEGDGGWDFIKGVKHSLAGEKLLAQSVSGLTAPEKPDRFDSDSVRKEAELGTRKASGLVVGASDEELVKAHQATFKHVAFLEEKRFENQLAHSVATLKRCRIKYPETFKQDITPEIVERERRGLLRLDDYYRKNNSGTFGLHIYDHMHAQRLQIGLGLITAEMKRRGMEPASLDPVPRFDHLADKKPSVAKRIRKMPKPLASLENEAQGRFLLAHAATGLEIPSEKLFPKQNAEVKALIARASSVEIEEVLKVTHLRLAESEQMLASKQLGVLHYKALEQKGSPLTAEEKHELADSMFKMKKDELRIKTDSVGLDPKPAARLHGLSDGVFALEEALSERSRSQALGRQQDVARQQERSSEAVR